MHSLPYSSYVNQSRKFSVNPQVLSITVCVHASGILLPLAANIRVVDPVREFGSPGLGNVAWKERVDGWKMKQDKNVVPMTTSHTASERGGDIDASTDVIVDDSLL